VAGFHAPDNNKKQFACMTSTDSGATWQGPVRQNRLLFASPASNLRQPQHPYGRTNLTVRVSCDDGAT
jgi:sialidase-1